MQLNEYRKRIRELRVTEHVPTAMRTRLVMAFLAVSDNLRAVRGDVLLQKDDPGEDVGYLLLMGSVEVEHGDAPTAVCEAPELLGEVRQFTQEGVCTATVTVVEEAVLLRFSWEAFFTACSEVFSEEEVQKVRAAIEEQAWEHVAD